MKYPDELRQMLRDASKARADRPWIVRAWHALAERVAVPVAALHDRDLIPKGPLMLLDDLRHALRRLRARPGTAVLAVAMLALAIGVTSTMFTVADHFVIRPAPFADPDRLVRVGVDTPRRNVTTEVVRALRTSPSFGEVEAIMQRPATFAAGDGLARSAGAMVTPGVFSMLGVSPIMGRTFDRNEPSDRVIVSEALWRTALGADPGIVGRVLLLDNAPVTVIGVMPAWFAFPYSQTRVWRPLDLASAGRGVEVFGRLAPGVTAADAADSAARVLQASALFKSGDRLLINPLTAALLDAYSRTAIAALSGGVALVFLVLCANVANLILARTNFRRIEFSVASALGASRARLLRQAFIENTVIGLVAAGAGLALAWYLTSIATSLMPASVSWRTLNAVAVDFRAVVVSSLLGLVATLVAGLPPAWLGTRVNAAESLRLSSRGATDSRESRLMTRALIVGEVALASTLLVGAGLLTTSFVRLMAVDPGMDTRSVMTAWVELPAFNYADKPSVITAAEGLRARMASMPGISVAALTYGLPPRGGAISFGTVETDDGRKIPKQVLSSEDVGPDAFAVLGIRILEGRPFDADSPLDDVVVSQALAERMWPGEPALGHSFTLNGSTHRVIGVAREVRSVGTDPTDEWPEFYTRFMPGESRQVMLAMRCAGACPPEPVVRDWLHSAGAGFLINEVQSLDRAYTLQFDRPRAAATLALIFAALALAAAAGGLFSVLTYAVGQRRREFGVRVALGARPGQLQRLVVRDGLVVAGIGLAIGGAGAWLAARWMSSLVYGVSTWNPEVWLAVSVTLTVATVLAAWRPARSASQADPISLLRDS